jgi:hypothetical protein
MYTHPGLKKMNTGTSSRGHAHKFRGKEAILLVLTDVITAKLLIERPPLGIL